MSADKNDLLGLEHVKKIAPYVGGKPISEVARQFGLVESQIIKLASNENPLGMPESAKRAMLAVMDDLGRYPDSNGFALKQALAEKNHVPQEWITLGNGSNDILELATRAVAQSGSEVIFSQHAFAVYPLATQAVGAKAVVIPPKPADLGHDLDAMYNAINANTQLIFVANPNNPTGSFLTGEEINAFIRRVPENIVVVLDEAYNEYLSPEQQYDAIAMVREFSHLVVSRSFSKAYGLAGLRLGYAVSQEVLTNLMNRIRQPFNVNSLAQAAAVAALQDTEFLAQGALLNQQGYLQLSQAFQKMQLHFFPSAGNFILVQVGDDDQAGARVNRALLQQGVIVRPVDNYGLPKFLRVSIGLPQENTAFITALQRALQTTSV